MLEHIRDSTSDGYFTDLSDRVPGGTLTDDKVLAQTWRTWLAFRGGPRMRPPAAGSISVTSHRTARCAPSPRRYQVAKRTYDPTRTFPLNDTQVGCSLDDLMQEGLVVQSHLLREGEDRSAARVQRKARRDCAIELAAGTLSERCEAPDSKRGSGASAFLERRNRKVERWGRFWRDEACFWRGAWRAKHPITTTFPCINQG